MGAKLSIDKVLDGFADAIKKSHPDSWREKTEAEINSSEYGKCKYVHVVKDNKQEELS